MDDTVMFQVIIGLIVVYLLVTIVGAVVALWRTLK